MEALYMSLYKRYSLAAQLVTRKLAERQCVPNNTGILKTFYVGTF